MDPKNTQPLRMIVDKTFPPIVSVVGNSGAGKTTFLEKLILTLTQRGFKVGTIKHDVHGFEMDRPGKDSWRHKQAGASTTIISSPYQIGMVRDVDHDHAPEELVPFLAGMDIILAEGFKKAKIAKLEIFRPEVHPIPLCKNDDQLLALISNETIEFGVPRFPLDDVEGVADFLIEHFKLVRAISSIQREAVS